MAYVPLTVDAAAFFGIILLSLLYGLFLALFCLATYVLIFPPSGRHINWPFLGSSIVFFLLITAYFIVRWMRAYDAFITYGNLEQAGALKFLTLVSDWHVATSTSIWAITGALGDLMLVYRLWLVWDRSYMVTVVPLLLCAGSLVTAFAVVYEVSNVQLTSTYATQLQNWAYAFLSLSLSQNVLVTSLIVGKIWRINMGVRGAKVGGAFSIWPVIAILLESGALYSTTVMVTLITYVSQNNGSAVLTDMIVPIIGITFMLIIVRVGLGFTKTRSNALSSLPNQVSGSGGQLHSHSNTLAANYHANKRATHLGSGRRPPMTTSVVEQDYPLHDIRVTLERDIVHEPNLDGKDVDGMEELGLGRMGMKGDSETNSMGD